ncbi:MAG: nicotinate-nucleotide adenylyltransferase [Maribacter sp.]|jgi:nicotinate-nucleotide adenylyltransferase
MKKIGLFFGSFNPVHVGHMIIAEFMAENAGVDKVWIVVSPQNPHKKKNSLANDYDRLHLVKLAIGENTNLEVSDIEFKLPQPSYTIDTLTYIQEKYPDKIFALIMGGDNLATLHKWKNYEKILENHEILVYKRPQYELGELENHPNVKMFDAPMLNISASYIRKQIKARKSIRYLVTEEVNHTIESENIYGKIL